MLTVGLTGTLASGKSTVAEMWAAEGVPVVSADELSRRAVTRGSEGLAEIRAVFGDAVIQADGTLDRSALRSLVFRDESARRRLEAILHPRILALRDEWLAERRREGAGLVVAEIPLLFEAGLADYVDVIVVIDAPEEVRLERLLAKRGLGRSEARRMMAAQMEGPEKRRRADHVLENAGAIEALERSASMLLDELRATTEASGSAPVASSDGVSEPQLRLDLHLHTWFSHDCLSRPERVLEAAHERGVGRVAVTDHDRLDGALRIADRFPDRVIPGEEVRTEEGIDVIGHYLTTAIPRGIPIREAVERIREQGGVVYLPHPYAPGKGGAGRLAEELAQLVDVVEVFNARLHRPELNRRAADLAGRHGRLRGAGSDAHTVAEVGRAWVEVSHHANDAESLLRALGSGRVNGEVSSRVVHLASTWAKVRKRLPHAPGRAPPADA